MVAADAGYAALTFAGTGTTTYAGTISIAGQRNRLIVYSQNTGAAVAFTGGRLEATPFPPKGSHDLAAYGLGNALLRVPAGGTLKLAPS